MPITVELQEMLGYSVIPVLIAVLVIVVGGIGLFLYCKKSKDKAVTKPVAKKIPVKKPVDTEQIRNKYYALIDDLEKQYQAGKLSNRKAYQKLSEIFRQFVFEVTGVKVINFTLQEIKMLNMPQLEQIIEECYAPEFSVNREGNIDDTINKTRMVIREWHL